MDAIQQSWNLAEMKGMVDRGNGMPGPDKQARGPQDPNLMDNLYSILTLSLVFFERITRPFENQSGEAVLSSAEELTIGS
jgi:hypothetical protein